MYISRQAPYIFKTDFYVHPAGTSDDSDKCDTMQILNPLTSAKPNFFQTLQTIFIIMVYEDPSQKL